VPSNRGPAHVEQKIVDKARPTAPTMIRIQPIASSLTPPTLPLTPQTRVC